MKMVVSVIVDASFVYVTMTIIGKRIKSCEFGSNHVFPVL